jgi:hypothetical protein
MSFMLSSFKLNAVRPSVVMPSVMAPNRNVEQKNKQILQSCLLVNASREDLLKGEHFQIQMNDKQAPRAAISIHTCSESLRPRCYDN